MSSLGFSLDIEEELWDSTKLSFVTMFTISIYKNQNRVQRRKERKKERKRVAKQRKRIGLGRVRSCQNVGQCSAEDVAVVRVTNCPCQVPVPSVFGDLKMVSQTMCQSLFCHSLERVLNVIMMMGTLQIQREEGAGGRVCFSSHGYQYWN